MAPAEETPAQMSAKEQCQGVLVNAWAMLQPALKILGEDAAAREQGYLNNLSFVLDCERLPPDQRACLVNHKDPRRAPEDCKINNNGQYHPLLVYPHFSPRRAVPGKLSEEAHTKKLQGLVGTWKSTPNRFKDVSTWIVSESGNVKQSLTKRGKTTESEFPIKFEREDEVTVYTPAKKVEVEREGEVAAYTTPKKTERYGYVVADENNIFIWNTRPHGTNPIDNKSEFTLHTNRGISIVYKGDQCTSIDSRGNVAKASCGWTSDTSFTATFAESTKRKPLTFDYVAGHLLEHERAEWHRYTRQ